MMVPRCVPIAMRLAPKYGDAGYPAPPCDVCTNLYTIAADVLPSDVPQLRGPRGHRLRVRRGGHVAARVEAFAARAQRVQLLPPQRRRRAAGMVVPPQRLPRVVHGRPRHPHQRRARDRAPGRAARCGRRAADAVGGEGRRRGPRHVTRLPVQPGERIDRSAPITFTFDGKTVSGFEGDTIASALYAGGRRTFSRSFKYHRRRGELCGCGQCANSLVQIGGRPGVRACAEPATDGLVVKHTNARPGLEFDVMRATDILGGPFTPPGFYYKTFIRPRRLWPVYEKVLRGAAGLGILPKRQDDREWRTEYRRRHCDVLVIGGGIAGLAAALRAAELGADVVLCDEDAEPGGALLWEGGHARARALADRCAAAGVEILTRAPALGFFDGLVPVWQGSTLHQIRAARHVAATGTLEQPLVFPDNDLPGVMLAGGARRLAALYAVKPGNAAVVATTNDRGLDAALALHGVGVRIAAVADLRADAGGGELAQRVEAAGIELLRGMTVVRAVGRQSVTGAVVAPVDASGYALEGHARTFACDLIAVSGGVAPSTSLLLQGGAKARYDAATGRFVADGLHDSVLAAGSVAGHDDADSAEASGLVAGAEAALALGSPDRAGFAGGRGTGGGAGAG